MPAKTASERVANKVLAAMNTLDFDPTMLLFALDNAQMAMKIRLINVLKSVVNDWAMKFDHGLWNDAEEMELYIQAKRWSEAMAVFDQEFEVPNTI